MRKLILIIISFVVLACFIFLFFMNKEFTGAAVLDKYSFTKAVCDENNYCQDFEISCENGKITGMRAVGEGVQFSENWEDPRDEEIRKKLC